MNMHAHSGFAVVLALPLLLLGACSDAEAPDTKRISSPDSPGVASRNSEKNESLADQYTQHEQLRERRTSVEEAGEGGEEIAQPYDGEFFDELDTDADDFDQAPVFGTQQPRTADSKAVSSSAKAGKLASKRIEHEVQQGDTLYKIAKQYQISLAKLIADNEINDANEIFVGEVLEINR